MTKPQELQKLLWFIFLAKLPNFILFTHHVSILNTPQQGFYSCDCCGRERISN